MKSKVKKKTMVITPVIIIMASLLTGCGEHMEENRAEEVQEPETETVQTDEWTETPDETGQELQANFDDAEEMTLLARIIYHNPDGTSTVEREYEYDSSGNRTRELIYDFGVMEWREWEYDSPENPTHETETHYDWDGNVDVKYERTYAPTGSLTGEVFYRYDEDGSIYWGYEYEYDFFGNKITEIRYGKNGSTNLRIEWEYDSFGNKITEIRYEENGSIISRCEWEYDSPENPTKETATHYNVDGDIIGWDEREYDVFGNRPREISYDADGNVKRNGWLEWEHDEYGNCTKEIWYKPDGRIGYWREFEYITLVVIAEED